MSILLFKKRLQFFLLITFFCNQSLMASDDCKVKLELEGLQNIQDEKTGKVFPTVYTGQTFNIKVVVSGGNKNTGQVEIDGLESLTVDGTSRSTSITMHNADFLSEAVYVYDVHSDSAGMFKIGPAKVRHNGKMISSNPEYLSFMVAERKGDTVVSSNKNVSTPLKHANVDGSGELFCRLMTDKDDVVVGEPLLLSLNIYSQGDILQVGLEPPNFEGFLSKDVAQQIRRRETIDGKDYSVLEKRFVLFPLQSGIKNIAPITVRFNVPVKNRRMRHSFFDDDFFSGFLGPAVQTRKTSSNGIAVHVEELPQVPFVVDGVGDFKSFIADVDKHEAVINEPILLSLHIEGQGNLDQILAPKLNVPSFFKLYESKVQIQQDSVNGYPKGKKRFEFVVQIGKEGSCKIPSQKFNYFDIESRSYKTLATNPIELNIKKPLNVDSSDRVRDEKNLHDSLPSSLLKPNKQKNAYKKDIHFIEEGLFDLATNKRDPISFWLFLLFLFSPFLFYSKGFLSILFGKITFTFLGGYLKKKSLSRFKNELEKIIDKKEASKIYRFFLDYFSAKFEVLQGDVSEAFIEKRLSALGFSEEKINGFLSFLNECASLSFATTMAKNVNYEKLLEKSRYWFFLIDGGR